MTMTAAGLKTAIKAQLTAVIPAGATMDDTFLLALATAIISYIETNNVVTVVTTCPAGPGTGTGAAA